jgi:hypothetical protein
MSEHALMRWGLQQLAQAWLAATDGANRADEVG